MMVHVLRQWSWSGFGLLPKLNELCQQHIHIHSISQKPSITIDNWGKETILQNLAPNGTLQCHMKIWQQNKILKKIFSCKWWQIPNRMWNENLLISRTAWNVSLLLLKIWSRVREYRKILGYNHSDLGE